MKFSAVALFAVLGYASAGRPNLSISVRDGQFDGIDGLDPTITWENSASSGDVDISYGFEAAARPTTDIASLPRNVWGKASTDVSGWGLTARAEVDAQARDSAELELDADNEANDLSLRLTANAGRSSAIRTIEATKGFDANGARVTVNPRYNVEKEEADVVLGYRNDATNVELTASADSQEVSVSHRVGENTNVKLTASVDAQELTISQQLDSNNRIAPTIDNNGNISLEWERSLGDDNSLTATLRPNESIDVEWRDDAWTANVNVPIDGTDITGTNVSVKRDVTF